MKKIGLLIALSILLISCDEAKNNLRKGNDFFDNNEYSKAEDNYLKALNKDSLYMKSNYNIANTNYRQNSKSNLEKSILYLDRAIESKLTADSSIYSKIFYNRGNSNFQLAFLDSGDNKSNFSKRIKNAINDYKSTLKINPDDSAAKYNLALANYLLKNQENKNQENKNENKEKENSQQNQSIQLIEDKKKEDNERMLEAMKNNEKQTLEKLKKEKDKKSRNFKTEKDW